MNWVANPRLTWADSFALFHTDGNTRPGPVGGIAIFQEELPVQVRSQRLRGLVA